MRKLYRGIAVGMLSVPLIIGFSGIASANDGGGDCQNQCGDWDRGGHYFQGGELSVGPEGVDGWRARGYVDHDGNSYFGAGKFSAGAEGVDAGGFEGGTF